MFKSPNKLKKSFGGEEPPKHVGKTDAAVKRLKELGKIPYAFGGGKIRLSHRGSYFDYSAYTGKWVYTRSAGRRKWRSSKSIDDFLNQLDSFMDWYDNNVRHKNRAGRKDS